MKKDEKLEGFFEETIIGFREWFGYQIRPFTTFHLCVLYEHLMHFVKSQGGEGPTWYPIAT